MPSRVRSGWEQHLATTDAITGDEVSAGTVGRPGQRSPLVFSATSGKSTERVGRVGRGRSSAEQPANSQREAGVRHVRLHDGRHTAVMLLLGENVHPRVVMELLGPSQMRTTMDIHSQVMPALAREAADRMSALLLPGVVTSTATRDESGRSPKRRTA